MVSLAGGEKNRELFWLFCCFYCFVVQSLNCARLLVTPRTPASQAPPSSAISQSLLKFMSIELAMLPNHLILCHPLLLLPSIFPIIRVFSNKSSLSIRWPKYWSFSFSISPPNEYSGLTSLSLFTFMHWRRKWEATPVFLPGESQGRRSLVGCHLWGRTELDTTEMT